MFGHDDDPIPDDILISLLVSDPPLIDKPDAVADPGVFVDDRPPDEAVPADSDRRKAAPQVGLDLLLRLKIIGPHDHRAIDDAALSDPGADPDDGGADLRTVDDAALAEDGVVDFGTEDLGTRKVSSMGENRPLFVVEVELGQRQGQVGVGLIEGPGA